MNTLQNPTWWTEKHDSSWERVKAAFKRDWDQTKHDMGSEKRPETNQNVNDTIKQASGKQSIPPRGQPVYEKAEPAYRFGYGARSQYGSRYPKWTPELEKELRNDWSSTYTDPEDAWENQSAYIRRGWDYTE